MMFWRFLLFFLLIFWGIQVVGKLLKSNKPKPEVKGKPKQPGSLNISDDDIEEVDFKEIKD